MIRSTLFGLLAGAATLGLALTAPLSASAETVKIGVTPGPHARIMEKVKAIAAKDGLDIQILEFSDYVVPNQALADGDLDANSFQHQPYLDNQARDRGYDLVSVAKTVIYPMGIYSKTLKTLVELPEGAKIAVPNDPTNGGRALLLLQAQGVIKLKEGAGLKASPLDLVDNTRKYQIMELDAAQLPRSLDDVSIAVINTNYATEAGLDPIKDPIAREAVESPYANVIVVRKADADKPWVAKLVKAYQNDEVKSFIQQSVKGTVPAW
jgi:D-methionine transport system substrate-binding protein